MLNPEILLVIISFAVVAIASKQIGQYFSKYNLPLISGFLFAGILVGPFALNLITDSAIHNLAFVDEMALAFIAFAAGNELYLKELRNRLKSIAWVTVGNVVAIPILGSLTIFLLADAIPFMSPLDTAGRIAISLLAGAILLARSPSSAIAVVNELRAKGPFTQTALGVTMVTDVVVIVVFAISLEIADALLIHMPFSITFVELLLGELLIAVLLGYILSWILRGILSLNTASSVKTVLIVLAGYSVFVISAYVRENSYELIGIEVLLEPLLECMIAGFIINNYSPYRPEFSQILHDAGPAIYVAFFTLTGASLALDILLDVWPIALALFMIRLVGIFVGSFAGGTIAGDLPRHNRLSWMFYVTQAGVGLGLAKEVVVEFPEWGTEFATVLIAAIVLSQLVGPPFIKMAINRIGEAHPRAKTPTFDGRRDALIFGVDDQALAVARQLQAHNWQVTFACKDETYLKQLNNNLDKVCLLPQIDEATLQSLDTDKVDAAVMMLSDEENYQLCELLYEHVGTDTMVVRLNDWRNAEKFHELGALIVEPGTAVVSLLDQFVRSPSTASLLLGGDDDQQMVDVEVADPVLNGVYLRHLRLPLDTLILSVRRDDHIIVSHGHTRLKLGDKITIVGSANSLEQVMLMFSN